MWTHNGFVHIDEVRRRYARFAAEEAPGRSEVYAAWAGEVAINTDAAAVIAGFPDQRTQPPLVFAVARLLGCAAEEGAMFADFLVGNAARMSDELTRRSLQTNEPLRCAALLPALSLISGPLALVELGASGGLCLYPDRYDYRFVRGREERTVTALGGPALELRSRLCGDSTPGLHSPEIVWRVGVDVHPLDVSRPEDAAWLRALVWPGETGRAERIEAAITIAAAEAPTMIRGDALDVLDEVVAAAPPDATLVVTTPGVLPYLPWQRRTRLVERLLRIPGRWITMDAAATHDGWRGSRHEEGDGFVLALDGEVLGRVDPLGAWVRWGAR